jgi:hypothetical protein
MLFGWGLFNVVEGVVDHHLLGIHHVREGANQTAWDLGFLALGVALLVGGWLLTRNRERDVARERVVGSGYVDEDADAPLTSGASDGAAAERPRTTARSTH